MKTEVLNHNQILRICNRFAFQIVENSSDNNELPKMNNANIKCVKYLRDPEWNILEIVEN